MISAACLIVLYFLRLCRNEVFSSCFVAEGVRCTFSCWCSLPLGSMLCVICFGSLSFFTIIGDEFDQRFGFFVVLFVVSQNDD